MVGARVNVGERGAWAGMGERVGGAGGMSAGRNGEGGRQDLGRT